MSDIGQDIEVLDTMTVNELIALQSDTQGRFSYTIDASGLIAYTEWVNYFKVSGKRQKIPERGCWKLLTRQFKTVVII